MWGSSATPPSSRALSLSPSPASYFITLVRVAELESCISPNPVSVFTSTPSGAIFPSNTSNSSIHNTNMHSQSPSTTNSPPATSSRRLSVGTKSRTCVHCGRTFRRTEHLERHVRTRECSPIQFQLKTSTDTTQTQRKSHTPATAGRRFLAAISSRDT
jgi:hypothetical protein